MKLKVAGAIVAFAVGGSMVLYTFGLVFDIVSFTGSGTALPTAAISAAFTYGLIAFLLLGLGLYYILELTVGSASSIGTTTTATTSGRQRSDKRD
jgi:hypothetical protein